jgi:hypothetical protein
VGYDVAFLLDRLREAGADDQAAALASRAAAHAALDHPGAVARLLRSLREAGAHEQAATLAGRLPAVGLFRLFLERNGLADQFLSGRETDGTPAAPWGWKTWTYRLSSARGDREATCPPAYRRPAEFAR